MLTLITTFQLVMAKTIVLWVFKRTEAIIKSGTKTVECKPRNPPLNLLAALGLIWEETLILISVG